MWSTQPLTFQLSGMAAPQTHYLFWIADDDPRGCVVIGYTYGSNSNSGRDKPIYYHFKTSHIGTETVTKVCTGEGTVVAQLDWSMGDQLGVVTIQQRQQFMSYLVMKGKTASVRMFKLNNQIYEWRRQEQADTYELYMNNTKLATFRHEMRNTPIGTAHGVMKYVFDDDPLLLEALVALCLNRWLASRETRGH